MSFSIDTTLSTAPLSQRRGAVWQSLATRVLPKKYELSVVFIGDTLMKRLNTEYRNKNKPTNVLAFPISETTGEIFIDIPYARREAKKFGHTEARHIDFLFIHGLLHLAGYDHGEAMEAEEVRLMKKIASH